MREILFSSVMLILTAIISLPCKGQGTWQWARSIGGVGDDQGNSVSVDSEANILVIGSFSGSVLIDTVEIVSRGDQDIFLAKYDPVGNLIWIRSAGSKIRDEGSAVQTDPYNNVYIAGSFADTAVFENTLLFSSGGNDVFLAKYNSSGELIWAKSGGGQYDDEVGVRGAGGGTSLSLDAQGRILVSGIFSGYGGSPPVFGTADFGTITLTSMGNSDVFFAKYDTSGTAIMAKSAGSNTNDNYFDIASDEQSNIYLTGTFDHTMHLDTIALNSPNLLELLFIAKYDSSGAILWAKKAESNLDLYSRSIAVDEHGNAYVTGDYYNASLFIGSVVLSNMGNEDIFIAKYNTEGSFRWARKAGGESYDGGKGVTVGKNHQVYLTGSFNQLGIFGNDTLSGGIAPDIFLAKYDTSGNVKWATSAGGAAFEFGNELAVDDENNIYITGYTTSPIADFGGHSISGSGGRDMFIAKFAPQPESINDINNSGAFLRAYPNPTKGPLFVSTNGRNGNTLRVTDVTGRKCMERKAARGVQETLLDLTGLTNGVYFVQLYENEIPVSTIKVILNNQ